jgi:hypothetical protein
METVIQTMIPQNFPEREFWNCLASKKHPFTPNVTRFFRTTHMVQFSAWVPKLRQRICGEYGV